MRRIHEHTVESLLLSNSECWLYCGMYIQHPTGGGPPGQARPRSLKGCLLPGRSPRWGAAPWLGQRGARATGAEKNFGCCLRGPLFGKRPSEARARHFRRAAGKPEFGGSAEDLDLNFGP